MSNNPHINHFTGSPLNRLSWLRPHQSFLNAIIQIPTTRWILFNNGNPLMVLSEKTPFSLAYLSTQDLEPLLGPQPYFGQGKQLGHLLPDADPTHGGHSPTESARHRGPRIVFLGLHETGERNPMSLPSSDLTDPEKAVQKLQGTPYFSVDVANSGLTDEELNRFLSNTVLGRSGKNPAWSEPLPALLMLDAFTAAVVASARTLVDWNQRNKFCPGCGSPSYSMWGGWKISCSSLLPWAEPNDKQCFTAQGLHNFMHPRTDIVVIMIAIDEASDKIFLGRGRRYPGKYYSALAGFIEPGESLEDAVAREMLEEAGVPVWDIRYHSGQPWPYPANLMIGFYARADSTKPVRVDLDKELIDARWFTRQEINSVLEHREDYQKMKDRTDGKQNTAQPDNEQAKSVANEPSFKVPPITSIAGVLIRDWIAGKIGLQREELKGNL